MTLNKAALRLFTITFFLVIATSFLFAEDDEEKKRKNTLSYGTEAQVIELLSTLKNDKNTDYLKDINELYNNSVNKKMKIAIIEYYEALEVKDFEEQAIEILKERDNEQSKFVKSVFSYLIKIKSKKALPLAQEIIKDNEEEYIPSAINLMASSGGKEEVEILKELYQKEEVKEEIKEQILLAYGKLKDKSCFDLLESIIKDEESSKVQKMYSCTALGELNEPKAIDVLIYAFNLSDPYVRQNAMEALCHYDDKKARVAIRQGMRDDHVLVRLAAVKSAGELKDEESIPFLEYKLNYDSEVKVKDYAITSLSQIGGEKAETILMSCFNNTKNSSANRAKIFSEIIKLGNTSNINKLLETFTAEQNKKDRAFFITMMKSVVAIKEKSLIPFIEVILKDKESSNRLLAITWIEKNKETSLIPKLEEMLKNDKSENSKKRLQEAIDKTKSK